MSVRTGLNEFGGIIAGVALVSGLPIWCAYEFGWLVAAVPLICIVIAAGAYAIPWPYKRDPRRKFVRAVNRIATGFVIALMLVAIASVGMNMLARKAPELLHAWLSNVGAAVASGGATPSPPAISASPIVGAAPPTAPAPPATMLAVGTPSTGFSLVDLKWATRSAVPSLDSANVSCVWLGVLIAFFAIAIQAAACAMRHLQESGAKGP